MPKSFIIGVDNMSNFLNEHHLVVLFSEFGQVLSIRIDSKDNDNRFAVVKMSSNDETLDALVGLNGRLIMGRKLR
jgi:RNA recognition motif-containing protein